MRLRWWRLPVKAIDQLDLPELPKGYYWFMTDAWRVWEPRVVIRRRVAGFCWTNEIEDRLVTEYALQRTTGSRVSLQERYQVTVNTMYKTFEKRMANVAAVKNSPKPAMTRDEMFMKGVRC